MNNTINTTATNNNGFLAAMGHLCDVVATADINACRNIGFVQGYAKAWIRDHEPKAMMNHMGDREIANLEGRIAGMNAYIDKKLERLLKESMANN